MTALTGLASTVIGLVAYALLGTSAVSSTTMSSYGMSLGSYLVSGLAFSPILATSFGLLLSYLNPNTTEELFVTPTGLRTYLVCVSSLSIMTTIASAVISFSVATMLLGLGFSYNLPLLAAVIALGVVASLGMGFLGLAFNMVYKQTAVLNWLLYTLTGLAGNMIVPVQVLPPALRSLSLALPQYYFFTGIRVALGSDFAEGSTLVAIFTVYSLVLLASSLFALNRALRTMRITGNHRWI